MDISVVIPTYNGAGRISAVLERLQAQQVPDEIRWEVLVVDNNSRDDLATVVAQWQQRWTAIAPLRYVFEKRQGSAFARQQGVEQAHGQLIGFLDDDNLPGDRWVSAACQFFQDRPQVGAAGSEIAGKFETLPAPSIRPILFYLALNQRGDRPLQYVPAEKGVPPGAGLVVRRQAWIQAVPETLLLVGRINQRMVAGEDDEAVLHLHRAGWEIWYNPAMKIDHYISSDRLQWPYLRRNLEGIGLSRYHLRMLKLPYWWQCPVMTVLYILSDCLKLVQHLLKHGQRIQTDVVANCEWALLWGTLVSPFYLLRVYFRGNKKA